MAHAPRHMHRVPGPHVHGSHAMSTYLEKAMAAIMPEVAPLVKAIEARPETTRGHYGEYMGLLSGMEKHIAMLTALAMIRCGANTQGVNDALHIVHGVRVRAGA